jgi:hypothetical protein
MIVKKVGSRHPRVAALLSGIKKRDHLKGLQLLSLTGKTH